MRKILTAGLLAGLLILPVGCGNRHPCEINPTSVGTDGLCYEADDELCDEDPCDADDFEEADKPKPGSTKKPVVRKKR